MRFSNKVVLVVGGNSGIGLASAQAFAAEGAQVIITGRNPSTLEEAAASMPGSVWFRTDIADPNSLDPVVAAVRARYERVDVLFVNAGVGAFSPAEAITTELWDEVHNINLRGCFFAAQKVLPLMGEGGSVLFTSSLAAVKAPPAGLIYAAAKAGMNAMARVLAGELLPRGIRVNVVSPGPVETPIIDRNIGQPEGAGEKLREFLNDVVPMKRMGRVEEVARAVLFLASGEASFITATNLFVDGGCSGLG